MERIERIQHMEAAFDASRGAIDRLAQALDEFDETQPTLNEFAAYYGSVEWFDDVEADELGELPSDLKRGVLGEDLPYDLLVEYHDLAIRMLQIATRALES